MVCAGGLRLLSVLAVLLCVLVSAGVAVGEVGTIKGVASVIDGDTIEIRGERIRLHGIDAPESRQMCRHADGTRWRCGQTAALMLADAIGRSPVACRVRGTDRYGRMIAVCHSRGTDLNAWLVGNGWAVAYRRYSRDYVADEAHAKSAGVGIWAGSFEMPWDWRRRH